jgi:hypothetical protein
MEEADIFDKWMRCAGKHDSSAWAPTLDLYDSFRRFCAATGTPDLGGIQAFSKKLARNLVPHRKKLARGWRGFRLHQQGERLAAFKERRLAALRAELTAHDEHMGGG